MPANVPTQDEFNALVARVTKLEQAAPTPAPNPTPDGTYTSSLNTTLIDDVGNAYALILGIAAAQGYQITKNGIRDPITQRVVKIGMNNRRCVQQNQDNNWWEDTNNQTKNNTPFWSPISDPTAQTPTGIFTVSGGAIMRPNGSRFRGVGVNVNYTRVWGDKQVDIGRVNLHCLQTAFPGINFVRFANWGGMLSPVGDAATIAWVKSLNDAGIVVMFDLHYSGNAIAANDQTANQWLSGWASYYKSQPMVWFETQNEPHGDPNTIAAMMIGQYNAVRGTGCPNPVILCCGDPGPEMTNMPKDAFSDMVNAAFDAHYYGWIPRTKGMSFTDYAKQMSGYGSKSGAMPVECLEFGNGPDSNTLDDNWQYVVAQATTVPAIFAAWQCNWTAETADCLLATPFDGTALTDYGRIVANAIKAG